MSARMMLFGAALCCFFDTTAQVAAAEDCMAPWERRGGVVRILAPGAGSTDPDPQYWTASGWFHRSPYELVTNWHVTNGFGIRHNTWTDVTLMQQRVDGTMYIDRMAVRLLGHHRHIDIAIIELARPIDGAERLETDSRVMSRGERLSIAAYANGKLQFGTARSYTRRSDIMDYVVNGYGYIPLDVQGDVNQSAFSGGSSGSPVMNCRGGVVGIMTSTEDEPVALRSDEPRVVRPNANRSPNAYAAKIGYLEELYQELDKKR